MAEEKYLEKDFRWEHGLYRAPNGVLLLEGLGGYYLVPEHRLEKIKKWRKIFTVAVWGIFSSFVAYVCLEFFISHFKEYFLLLLLPLIAGVIFFFALLSFAFFSKRGLERIKVKRADWLDEMKLEAQKHSLIVWVLITIFTFIAAFICGYDDWVWRILLTIFALDFTLCAWLRWKQDKQKAG